MKRMYEWIYREYVSEVMLTEAVLGITSAPSDSDSFGSLRSTGAGGLRRCREALQQTTRWKLPCIEPRWGPSSTSSLLT